MIFYFWVQARELRAASKNKAQFLKDTDAVYIILLSISIVSVKDKTQSASVESIIQSYWKRQ